ncbi:Endo-1,4-beta-xylanase/feruloyl esterase precursor [Planctomycetes bacterium CA13]|uniref:Beta-xylanase n=1 Tax=Novipirellula herctigrandis TaxID=2527986 RepID=A0A5C5YPB5_9BACT|nr:Endo-1,4-beta-xylanase/feruloyl esterase precursor [Planctomycetes bacterium CA13]
MKKSCHFWCAVAFATFLSTSPALADTSDESLWKEAGARIEKHRKTDVVICVVDRDGKPVPNVPVRFEQTRHAFLFGSNIFRWQIDDANLQTMYRDRYAKLLNFATAGFYWQSYEWKPGKTKLDQTKNVARWCDENRILLKGHPLAWNHSDPKWLPDDSDAIFDLQQQRITDCITSLDGEIDTWDVVNEPTHVDRKEFVQRAPKLTRMWMDKGQIEFVKACFQTARAAGPSDTLLVNDYRVDDDYAAVIEQLVDANGKPLYDKIGIQSHQHGGTWSNHQIWAVCERFAKFGVPLHFTEVTILSGELGGRADDDQKPWPSTLEGEAYQQSEVERFYTMLYSHPAVEAITWWDFSDLRSWKNAPAGLLRADMTTKPAYHSLMRLIHNEWWTDEQLETDSDGKMFCRATYGDYKVTVTSDKGEPVSVAATVYRGRANEIVLQLP